MSDFHKRSGRFVSPHPPRRRQGGPLINTALKWPLSCSFVEIGAYLLGKFA